MTIRCTKKISITMFAALSLIVSATAISAPAEVRLGIVQVLSGPNAKFGGQTYKGIQLAAEQVNARGGVKGIGPLKLVVEDSAGNRDQAVNAFRRLIAQEKVTAIIGPTLSSEALATGRIACEREVPMLTVNATAKGIPDVCSYVFRTSLAEQLLIPLSVSRAKAKYNIKRAAIFYANDDPNMVQSLEIYKAIAAKEKIDIVDIESFSTKDTDFSAQLTKVKSMDVDAIFTGAYPDTGASILTQAAKLGLPKKTVFVGGNGFNSPKIIELAGASAEGLVVSSPWFIDRKDPENVEFISLYRKKFKEDPDTYAAQGYQGLMLMVTAIETSPLKTPASIRDTLAKSRIHGLFGDFSFAPNRDPSGVGNAVTLQVKDGKFAPM